MILDVEYDNDDIVLHLDVQNDTHSIVTTDAIVQDVEQIELQHFELSLLPEHRFSLDEQQKSIISPSLCECLFDRKW